MTIAEFVSDTYKCKISECTNNKAARGWCTKHYKRWYKTGDPLSVRCAPNGTRKKHPLYQLYTNILSRCYNENNRAYEYYGGRGIIVCDRWRGVQGFDYFVQDMGDRPNGYSIDRLNNELGYFPDNCVWATPKQQANNRRRRSR